jgi:hypothetical protein
MYGHVSCDERPMVVGHLLDLHGEDGPEDVIPKLGGDPVSKIKVCNEKKTPIYQRHSPSSVVPSPTARRTKNYDSL